MGVEESKVKTGLLAELDGLIDEAKRLEKSFSMNDWGNYESDIPESEHRALVTSAKASIRRIAGTDSEFFRALPEVSDREPITARGDYIAAIPAVWGALSALRNAVDGGLLISLENRLRANFHDDFLDQSRTLLDAGYHVAAMVLIGGVLEDHLRRLCTNHSLTWTGKGNLSGYNDILRDNVYPQPTWRRIQAIGDVRNYAAHGDVQKVNRDDVVDAQKYVLRILADYPA